MATRSGSRKSWGYDTPGEASPPGIVFLENAGNNTQYLE
jgi:hypothetical protein